MRNQKLLILFPYENLYPPQSGGMQRCFHQIHQFSKHFDTTIVIHQPAVDFLKAAEEFPAIKNVKVFSTGDQKAKKDIFSLFPKKIQPAFRYRWLRRSLKGPADSHFLKYNQVLKSLLKENKYDAIVLQNIATLKAVSFIRRHAKKAVIVYDAQNVDTHLAEEAFEKGQITKEMVIETKRDESTLYKTVDAIMLCSINDLKSFNELNQRKLNAAVIPNGMPVYAQMKDEVVRSQTPDRIIFCGSMGYSPNVEGLLWFYNSIWPLVLNRIPSLKLLIIGSGKPSADLNKLLNDTSIVFAGMVPDVKEYYNMAAVSIVPLKSGSGTRLKILEAMSLGVPVVSTYKGAEGIEYTNEKNILIADEESTFADCILKLISDRPARLEIRDNARKLISEQYDWNIIGNKMHTFLEEVMLTEAGNKL